VQFVFAEVHWRTGLKLLKPRAPRPAPIVQELGVMLRFALSKRIWTPPLTGISPFLASVIGTLTVLFGSPEALPMSIFTAAHPGAAKMPDASIATNPTHVPRTT